MKPRDWALVLLTVVVVWAIDRGTKLFALEHIRQFFFWGPFGFVIHRNPGAMLGMFSDLPPILRVVSLSTGGAFLVFVYGAIQYLLPIRAMDMRLGMSLLLGGILGNVTDRIVWGSVVDFILIGTETRSSPAFNFADAIQWVGYLMIVRALILQGQKLWPNENERKKIWINPTFQWKYCFKLVGIGFAFSIIAGVYTFTFLKVTIDDLVIGRSVSLIEKKFLIPFLFTFAVISVAFMGILFMLGRILSHRLIGPIYAFERFVGDLIKGQDRPLKLRKGDEFLHLEELAEKIRAELRPHLLAQKKEAEVVDIQKLEDPPPPKASGED